MPIPHPPTAAPQVHEWHRGPRICAPACAPHGAAGRSFPSGVPPATAWLTDRTAAATRAMLEQARTVEQVVSLAASAQAFAEELIEEAKRRTNAPPVACRAGCPWCCHVTVTTTVPEVIQISEHLKAAAGEQAARGLHVDTIDEYAERVRGLTLAQRAVRRLRCPIQDPDTAYCSLWPIRPLLCRSWTSADESKCRQAFYEPTRDIRAPVLRVQRDIAQAIGAGLVAGLRAAGLKGGTVYLVDALQIALAEPDAAWRWLAGEPVFENAEVGEQCLVVVEVSAGGSAAPQITQPAGKP